MEKKGKRVAVVISPETDDQVSEQQERQRAIDWAVIDRIGERNADKDPDEVLADVTEVVEHVRQERYERRKREQARDRRRHQPLRQRRHHQAGQPLRPASGPGMARSVLVVSPE